MVANVSLAMCGPIIELVGGAYCGVIIDTKTGVKTTVTEAPVQPGAFRINVVPAGPMAIDVKGERGTFRYARKSQHGQIWFIQRNT